jgi:hypothetical protein
MRRFERVVALPDPKKTFSLAASIVSPVYVLRPVTAASEVNDNRPLLPGGRREPR